MKAFFFKAFDIEVLARVEFGMCWRKILFELSLNCNSSFLAAIFARVEFGMTDHRIFSLNAMEEAIMDENAKLMLRYF